MRTFFVGLCILGLSGQVSFGDDSHSFVFRYMAGQQGPKTLDYVALTTIANQTSGTAQFCAIHLSLAYGMGEIVSKNGRCEDIELSGDPIGDGPFAFAGHPQLTARNVELQYYERRIWS